MHFASSASKGDRPRVKRIPGITPLVHTGLPARTDLGQATQHETNRECMNEGVPSAATAAAWFYGNNHSTRNVLPRVVPRAYPPFPLSRLGLDENQYIMIFLCWHNESGSGCEHDINILPPFSACSERPGISTPSLVVYFDT